MDYKIIKVKKQKRSNKQNEAFKRLIEYNKSKQYIAEVRDNIKFSIPVYNQTIKERKKIKKNKWTIKRKYEEIFNIPSSIFYRTYKNKNEFVDILTSELYDILEKKQITESPAPPEEIIFNNRAFDVKKILEKKRVFNGLKAYIKKSVKMILFKNPVNDEYKPILRGGRFDEFSGRKIIINDEDEVIQNIFKIEDATNTPYNLEIKNMCVVNEILTLTKGTRRGAENLEDIINIIYNLKEIELYKCDEEGHIIYKLGQPVKALITKENILKYGVNKIILKKLCLYLNIILNIFYYDFKGGFFYLEKERIIKDDNKNKNKSLSVIIDNNHLYLLDTLNTIKKYNSIYQQRKQKEQEGIRNNYFKFREEKEKEKENLKIIIKNDEEDLFNFLKNSDKLPSFIVFKNDNLNSFIVNNNKYIIDYDKDILDELKERYKGETAGSIAGDYIKKYINPSFMSDEIYEALNKDFIKHRGHVDIINSYYFNKEGFPLKEFNIKKFDVNKAYRHIMENLEYLLSVDLTQKIIKTNKKHGVGLYYIKPINKRTDKIHLLHSKNWYSLETLNFCDEIGEEYKIIYFINGVKGKNKFKDIINTISTDYNKINSKKIINSLCGICGIIDKFKTTARITADEQKVFKFINENNKDIYLKKTGNLYIYGFKTYKKLYNNNLLIYIQILDNFNILAYKRATGTGGQILARNIDAFYVLNPTNTDHLSDEIGDYKEEAFKPVKSYNKLRDVIYTYKEQKINILNIEDNKNLKYDDIKNGLLLTGAGGTGKTYKIKKILEEEKKEVIFLAPTNAAARILGGQTIHSFFKLNEGITKNNIKMKIKQDFLVIDEAGMITADIWEMLYNIKRENLNLKFVIMGDYHQLESIEDLKYNFTKNNIILSLCNYNYNEFKVNYRQDKAGLCITNKLINGVNIELKIQKKNCYDGKNIVWFNSTRKKINKIQNEREKKNKHFIKLKLNEDDRNDAYIFNGLKVICNKTKKAEDNNFFFNGEVEEIIRMNEETQTLHFKSKKKIAFSEFSEYFTLSYAITIYKAQGQTYKGRINIYDIETFKKNYKYLYTGISRATEFNNVYFYL